jgi:two-component system CheB/CheR fusion protein
MPYRTFDDRIDGIVITFINITNHKKIESKLLATGNLNQLLLSASTEIKVILSGNLEIIEFNPKAEKFFGTSRENCINQNFIQKFVPEKEQKNAERTLTMQLNKDTKERFKMKLIDARGNFTMANCFVTLSLNDQNFTEGMILSIKKQ